MSNTKSLSGATRSLRLSVIPLTADRDESFSIIVELVRETADGVEVHVTGAGFHVVPESSLTELDGSPFKSSF